MRNKSLYLLAACVFGTIAAVGVSRWMHANSGRMVQSEMVEIFVTAREIESADAITADAVRLEKWPAERVPKGATGDLTEIEGRFTRQKLYEGEPIVQVKLTETRNNASQPPAGFKVVSIKAGTGDELLQPGDRVDVDAYFEKSELIPETTAMTVINGVRVWAVDNRTERLEDLSDVKAARTISLLISKEDTQAWFNAGELGRVHLTLGNPHDDETGEGQSAADRFMQWLGDHRRARDDRVAAAAEANRPRRPAPVVLPSPPAPAAPTEPKKTFTMLKMSGGRMIEYRIEEGYSVPQVVPSDDRQVDEVMPPAPPATAASDYSYLNGSGSPFYQSGQLVSPE